MCFSSLGRKTGYPEVDFEPPAKSRYRQLRLPGLIEVAQNPVFGKYEPLLLAPADGILGALFGIATEFAPGKLLHKSAIQRALKPIFSLRRGKK